MTTHEICTADKFIPAQKWTEHDVMFQYFIGVPSTDDHLISEKVANFEFSKFDQKEKLFLADQENLENDNIKTLERVFLV